MKYNKLNSLMNNEIYNIFNMDVMLDNADMHLNRYLDWSYNKAFATRDFTYRFTKRRKSKQITNEEIVHALDDLLNRKYK